MAWPLIQRHRRTQWRRMHTRRTLIAFKERLTQVQHIARQVFRAANSKQMDVCNKTPSRYLIASRGFEETSAFIFNGLEFRMHSSRYSRPLKIKALSPFETSGSAYRARRHHIPEERHHCYKLTLLCRTKLPAEMSWYALQVTSIYDRRRSAGYDAKPTVHTRSHGWYTRQTFVACDYLSHGRKGSLVQPGRPVGRPLSISLPLTVGNSTAAQVRVIECPHMAQYKCGHQNWRCVSTAWRFERWMHVVLRNVGSH
jgi:hypothetical protein